MSSTKDGKAERLIFLRYQIRSLKKRERALLTVLGKTCQGLHGEATQDLENTRKHITTAEEALRATLAGDENP